MPKCKFGIIAAVPDEVRQIVSDGYYNWRRADTGVRISDKGIALAVSGIGKANAAHWASKLMMLTDELWIIGTSGGLRDEAPGSLYLVQEFVEHDMDATGLGCPPGVTPFSPLKEAVIRTQSNLTQPIQEAVRDVGLTLKAGRVMSGDCYINDAAVAREKLEQFEADLVDMESAAVAKICALENCGCIALRYVSDNANPDAQAVWKESVKKASELFNRVVKKVIALS